MDKATRHDRYEYLAHRWRKKTISAEEEAELMAWLNSYDKQGLEVPMVFAASEAALKAVIYKEIEAAIGDGTGVGSLQLKKFWPRIVAAVSMAWKVAAAAVAMMSLGLWLYYLSASRHPELGSGSPLANDIAPGKNTATLTLANGKTIALSDAKTGVVVNGSDLKYNDNTFVIQSDSEGSEFLGTRDDKRVQMLMASTPRGGTYQVVLPDGTKVWLNADSKLSFPSQFSGRERKVMLEGEAYFVVVHNAKQPFKVESRGQVVEDIGTEFNINAYADENAVKTTLVEGEAAVNGTILRPNQQATLTANSTIKVTQVDPSEAIDWRNGLFIFNKEPLEQVMQRVARWYNVEVVYEKDFKSRQFTGSVSRFENISAVLRILELTGTVHFKIEGRKVIVTN